MLDDIEDMIKQKLLEDLIDQMGSQNGSRLKPQGLAVQVEAPDKEHLSAGLDHAKGALEDSGGDEDDDLRRLMEMAGKDADDEDDESFKRGR